MRLDISNIQEALKEHDSWIEGVSRIRMRMQEKVENLTEDIINLKNETADWREDVSNTLQQMQETEETQEMRGVTLGLLIPDSDCLGAYSNGTYIY